MSDVESTWKYLGILNALNCSCWDFQGKTLLLFEVQLLSSKKIPSTVQVPVKFSCIKFLVFQFKSEFYI